MRWREFSVTELRFCVTCRSDATCIICREEMSAAKKLPCGHLFHIHCLRSWLERQQTCPTCRSSVLAPEGGTRAATDPAAANHPRQLDAGWLHEMWLLHI